MSETQTVIAFVNAFFALTFATLVVYGSVALFVVTRRAESPETWPASRCVVTWLLSPFAVLLVLQSQANRH